jgi:hypothetical protein
MVLSAAALFDADVARPERRVKPIDSGRRLSSAPLTGIDDLRSLAVLGKHSEKNIPDFVELVGLAGRGRDRVGSYSMGMKQRLGIAASLAVVAAAISTPDVRSIHVGATTRPARSFTLEP